MLDVTRKCSHIGSTPILTTKIKVMEKDVIITIYERRLKKHRTCSYGAFLRNWSKYGWVTS